VRGQAAHPYSIISKITILYTLMFRFFIWDEKTKYLRLNDSKHSINLIGSWFHHECHSDLLMSSPSTWTSPYFQTFH
jgi:hypothetical protein